MFLALGPKASQVTASVFKVSVGVGQAWSGEVLRNWFPTYLQRSGAQIPKPPVQTNQGLAEWKVSKNNAYQENIMGKKLDGPTAFSNHSFGRIDLVCQRGPRFGGVPTSFT